MTPYEKNAIKKAPWVILKCIITLIAMYGVLYGVATLLNKIPDNATESQREERHQPPAVSYAHNGWTLFPALYAVTIGPQTYTVCGSEPGPRHFMDVEGNDIYPSRDATVVVTKIESGCN